MPKPIRPGNLATLITPLIKRNITLREGTRILEAQGLTLERGTLLRAWSQVQVSLSKRMAVSLSPPSRRPGPQERTVWNVNRGKGYIYQLEMTMHNPTLGLVFSRLDSVRSPKLITYNEAMQLSLDRAKPSEELSGDIVLSIVPTGVYELRQDIKYEPPLGRAAIERFGPEVSVTDIPLFGGGVAVRGAGGRFVGGISE